MSNCFRGDILGKDQLVHLTDRTWIKHQTGYILRMRPESESYRRAIEHYHGYSLTDVQVNQTRHPVKPIIKNIIHFYVKIISICMNKAGQDLDVEQEVESGEIDPFNYLDERGFEDYCISILGWNIETPYILKTILEVMLNKPRNKPIKDTLIYLFKRQPEVPKPNSLELAELWINLVECVIGSYDEIVIENDPPILQVPFKKKATFTDSNSEQKTQPSFSVFELVANPIWFNILDSFEEIQKYTSRMKNDTKMVGKIWPRIAWYDKTVIYKSAVQQHAFMS